MQALRVALLAHAAKHMEALLCQQGRQCAPDAGRGARDDHSALVVRVWGGGAELPAKQVTQRA